MKRHQVVSTATLIFAAHALACTGDAPARGPATDASASPYASSSGGDAVDKARAGAEKAGEKIKEGAEKTGEAVKGAAEEVKKEAEPVAKEVGEKIKKGAEKTGEAIDATKQHLEVKAALLADKTVDASHIDIDVDKDKKILYLRGTVPTAAQKAAAARIARDKADGFTVRNELTVMAVPKK